MGRQNANEVHPRRTLAKGLAVISGAIALGSVGLAVDGYVYNDVRGVPKGSCASPYRISKTYKDPGTITLLQTDTGMFTGGVIVTGVVARSAYGEQAAYRNPNKPDSKWITGDVVVPYNNHTGQYAAKMAIGAGPVEFGIRNISPQNSEACSTAPNANFRYVDPSEYFLTEAALPYEWPVNVAVNALGGIAHSIGNI